MFGQVLKRGSNTHFAVRYVLGHDEAFHLLEARRGRGKSFTMVYWALQCCKKKIPVVANFHLNKRFLAYELIRSKTFANLNEAEDWIESNVRYADSWDDIMTSYNCLVLLDEVNRLFDSQDRSKDTKAPRVVYEWLQLSRRNRITLVCAAQSMDWLASRVRQLFDYLWRAKKEIDKRGNIKRFWLYGSDPWAKGLSSEVQRQADFKTSVPFHTSVFRLYDTRERIKAIDPESRFKNFFEIYEYQKEVGIVPLPLPEKPAALRWSEYEKLWHDICERVKPEPLRGGLHVG